MKERIQFCKGGGCTAKLGAGALNKVLGMLPKGAADENLLVGYDSRDDIAGLDFVDYFECDEKDKITMFRIYLKDAGSIAIDGYSVDSISQSCAYFEGEMYDSNGSVCLIQKDVGGRVNYVMFYGNILSDNTDETDHIEVYIK